MGWAVSRLGPCFEKREAPMTVQGSWFRTGGNSRHGWGIPKGSEADLMSSGKYTAVG